MPAPLDAAADDSQPVDVNQEQDAKTAVDRAFGAQNRARLLERYFRGREVYPSEAWKDIYQLLLWIDRTTGLAHCYESDKAQPGRNWYARSLAFHDFVSKSLGVPPADMGGRIDWLFREAIKDLAGRSLASRNLTFTKQRQPYSGRGFPEPGEDPELVSLIREELDGYLARDVPSEVLRRFARSVHAYIAQENKRKNLVGEGFEDSLAAVVTRVMVGHNYDVRNRALLHEIPGFRVPVGKEKAERVDLALIAPSGRRILISAKWSVRADRERQFDSEFQAYAHLESAGHDFDYVLITNEFDAARLNAACERRRQNGRLFTHVVHIAPDGVLAAYEGAPPQGQQRRTYSALCTQIATGRLLSLGAWLESLS